MFADAGWDRERIVAEISSHLNRSGAELVRGADGIAEGVPEAFASAESLPKFRPGGLMLTYAGGGAGLFSQIIGGWVNGGQGLQTGHPARCVLDKTDEHGQLGNLGSHQRAKRSSSANAWHARRHSKA